MQAAFKTKPNNSKSHKSVFDAFKSLFDTKSFHYEDLNKHIKEVSEHEYLRQYIPFLSILSDHRTILTKNHTLIRVIKIAGVDSSNFSEDQRREYSNIRDNFFSFLSPDIRANFYTIRRELSDVETSDESDFKNPHTAHISNTWHSQFKNSYVSDTYLVLSKNYPSLSRNLSQLTVSLNIARKEFNNFATQAKTLLSKFGPTDLVNNQNHQLFKFFSYLINCYEFNSKSERDLFNNLTLSNISFNQATGLIKISNDKVKKFSKILGVRVSAASGDEEGSGYSDESLLRILSTVNHEFTMVQQVRSFSKEKNISDFKAARKTLKQLPEWAASVTRDRELEVASERIEGGEINFLDYSFYIKVFGDSEEGLENAVADIQNTLANEGIISLAETIGVCFTFFGLLPDQEGILNYLKTSIRARITKQNVSDYVNLFANKKGFRKSPFGEGSVVDFKTISTTVSSHSHSGNYSFTFHQDDISDRALGHTMIIGQTGTGKSTLAAFLLMNCLKFEDIKILCFDSGQGLKTPISVFDGKYITVGKDSDLKLNPMRQPDSFANRNFQKRFIEMLAKDVEEKEEATVEEVIRQNYTLDEEDRSLRNLKLAFGLEEFDEQTNRQTIASRIKKWIGNTNDDKNEIYANFFNNAEDNLDFASNFVAFDMGEVIRNQELLAPTCFYIFHKFTQLIENNPAPHVFFIDEMQKYLESKEFNPHIITAIKESRKRNGIFVGCMQEASTLVNSPNGDEIIANLATLIIFPNSKARPEDYITGLNLTDSEFEFVKNHPNPRHVLIKKKDGHSVIVDADLSILGKHLKLYSSKDTDRKLMEKLQAETPESWVESFLGEGAE